MTPSMNRRQAMGSLAATSMGVCGLSASGAPGQRAQLAVKRGDGELMLRLSGYKLDRVEALIDGRVTLDRCRTTFEVSTIGDMNSDVFGETGRRDVTEIGLSPFMHAVANDGFDAYSLIPVFPLRLFRHKSIFIRTDRGIRNAEDLRGKKIATAGYSSTSLTWIRGILQQEYGVTPEDVHWYVSRKDSSAKFSGGPSGQELLLPEDLEFREGPAGKTESDLLANGDVDALYHAAEPKAYLDGHPKVARLFPDYRQTERAFFHKTGIFPIMHSVAIRNELIDQHPWLPKAVFEAYSASKQLAYDRLNKLAWFQDSLPWVGQEVEETRKLMGENYWPYGIEPNRKALETLFAFSFEQGLCKKKLKIEDLFHASTLDFAEAATRKNA